MGETDVQQTLFEAVKKDEASATTPDTSQHTVSSESPAPAAEPISVPEALQPLPTKPTPPLQPTHHHVSASEPESQPLPPTADNAFVARRPLTREEQNKLFGQMDECKKTVSQLRGQLISLNDKKRAAFMKKDEVSNKIRALISEVKSARSERDKLTHLVHESKGRRKDLQADVRVKIEEIQKLNKEKQDLIHKHNLSDDPSRIKKEIDDLDYKIETEALSPSEEKQVMKIIKEKKKIYEEAKGLSSIFEKIHALSKEIEKAKYKCDETHKKIQSRAANSQEKHQTMVETVKGLDELRTKEKEAGKKFFAVRKEFDEVNDQLQIKLMELGQMQSQVGAIKKETFQLHKKKENATLTQKKQAVEQKLKQKKKLTTEDIIAMQG
ncbi:MAG: hypothetical protein Q7R76_03515 [Candidatus Woesearchaeota archaeon]|nr:hypothetical protein [Candidatus Woesearchaeota archaeon]